MERKEAIEVIKKNWPDSSFTMLREALETLIPEFKESEDERIRKKLLSAFKGIMDYADKDELWYGLTYSDILAWLEKQGKHANFRNKIQIGDKVTRNKDGVLVNLSQLNRVAKKQGEQKPVDTAKQEMSDEEYCSLCMDINCDGCPYVDKSKHKEQKPVEWRPSKEVMDVLYSLCYVSDIMDEHKDTVLTKLYQELKREYFNSASYENMFPKEEKIKQSLTKWNEEDDKKLSSIIDLTNYAQDTWSKKYMIEVRDWLKSIKDRVQLQPKQEWSEEDEKKLNDIIKDLVHPWNEYIPDRIEDEIKWLKNKLKSLKERYTWKPSDEQMDALHYVTNFDYGGHKATLVSLYEQLKKLKA